MFDAKTILDALVASASENTTAARQKANELGATDLGSTLRDVFGQATDGVRDGASQISDKTGAGDALNGMLEQFGGGSADELLGRAKEWAGDNKAAAGGILGGLGALVLGTRTGRGLATGAAKAGALALIAGLAYKAYQNQQAGRPLISRGEGDVPDLPPSGSEFDVAQVTNDDAKLYLRAMIAGAASDGHIDDEERKAIMGGVRSAGMGDEAANFLEDEFGWPATAEDLALDVKTPEQAAQVYTAARMTIGGENAAEQAFLDELSERLKIDAGYIEHIDAEVQGIQV